MGRLLPSCKHFIQVVNTPGPVHQIRSCLLKATLHKQEDAELQMQSVQQRSLVDQASIARGVRLSSRFSPAQGRSLQSVCIAGHTPLPASPLIDDMVNFMVSAMVESMVTSMWISGCVCVREAERQMLSCIKAVRGKGSLFRTQHYHQWHKAMKT